MMDMKVEVLIARNRKTFHNISPYFMRAKPIQTLCVRYDFYRNPLEVGAVP